MHELELVLGLLVGVTVLATLARRIGIPYPILLVLGGLVLSFAPGLTHVELDPEIVFLVFLPPLLFSAGALSSVRDLRANLRPIALLAVGLVLFTLAGVAAVAQALIPGLGWAAACVLGAIVSPPDAVAATAVAQRLGLPRRVVTILEGESLLNDATALVAYRLAVAAVVTGTFSAGEAIPRFFYPAIGGTVIGLAIAWLAIEIRARLHDPPVEVTVSLLTPYAAYLSAEALGLSGVLAAVAAGLYTSWHGPVRIAPNTRLLIRATWGVLLFILNGLVFILIGLQLRGVLDRLDGQPLADLLVQAVVISLAVIVLRFIWVFPATYLPRYFFRRIRERDPYLPWRAVVIVAWAGMRGVVSLAAALALPLVTASGDPFPERDRIVFLTFGVILATLVVQGLSLPPLIRWLRLGPDTAGETEESKARLKAALAGIARLEELAAETWTSDDVVDHLRAHYQERAHRFKVRFKGSDHDDHGDHESDAEAYRRLQRELLAAERAAIIQLRNEGYINDEVLRRIEREIDLAAVRLGV